MAPQGWADAPRDRVLLEEPAHLPRVRAGVLAAHRQRAAVAHVGPLRLLPRVHVRPHEGGGGAVPDQAHELPLPRAHVPRLTALLPLPALQVGGAGHRIPLRALGHALGPLPGAGVHAGRRPHLLPPRAGGGRDLAHPGPHRGGAEQVRLHQVPDQPVHAARQVHRQRPRLGPRHRRPGDGAEAKGVGLRDGRGWRRLLRPQD
mmetsp:Transcript_51800/g.135126  ORF Transcript_51800/g.135126 Transcript_51800/m.135126 type:complete len:203 (-) Transcript_51800:415-1023(-)